MKRVCIEINLKNKISPASIKSKSIHVVGSVLHQHNANKSGLSDKQSCERTSLDGEK